jgi:type II secretory pathway component PulF
MKSSTLTFLFLAALLWLSVGIIVVFVVPVFTDMFAEAGARLPAATLACFHLSRHSILFTSLLIGVVVTTAGFIVEKEKKIYAVLFLVSGALAVLALIIALFLPIFYRR